MRCNIKGISLIALIITIAVIVILAAVTVQKGFERTDQAKLAKHNTNISNTQEEVENYYYYKGAELPVVNLTPYPISSNPDLLAEITKNNEQNDNFYVLDLSKLSKTLGKDGTGTGDDIYIVSSTKHNVYYVRGTTVKGIVYHGLSSKGNVKLAQIVTPTSSQITPSQATPPAGEVTNILNDTDGDGYKEIWYLEQLEYIKTNVTTLSQQYELMRDMDFQNNSYYLNISNKTIWTTGTGWIPIGDNTNNFKGKLNGNGYVIKNLYINQSASFGAGLFGCIDNSVIQKIGIEGADISHQKTAGILVVSANHSSIQQVYTTGNVTITQPSIPATSGGIVGYMADDPSVLANRLPLKDCYSIVTIANPGVIGVGKGLIVGNIFEANTDTSYGIGNLNDIGIADDGGIPPGEYSSKMTNMFNSTSNDPSMKLQSTYTNFDFSNIWAINPDKNNGYPYLKVFEH